MGVGLLAATARSLALVLLGLVVVDDARRTRWLETGCHEAVAQIVWVGWDLDLVPFRPELCIHIVHERWIIVPPLCCVSTRTILTIR